MVTSVTDPGIDSEWETWLLELLETFLKARIWSPKLPGLGKPPSQLSLFTGAWELCRQLAQRFWHLSYVKTQTTVP